MEEQAIVYVKYGMANRFDNHIELNEALKEAKYLKLRQAIIEHELGHKDGYDVKHEFKFNYKQYLALMMFMLTHPNSWIDLSPVQYRNKEFILDPNLLTMYGVCIACIVGLVLIF